MSKHKDEKCDCPNCIAHDNPELVKQGKVIVNQMASIIKLTIDVALKGSPDKELNPWIVGSAIDQVLDRFADDMPYLRKGLLANLILHVADEEIGKQEAKTAVKH